MSKPGVGDEQKEAELKSKKELDVFSGKSSLLHTDFDRFKNSSMAILPAYVPEKQSPVGSEEDRKFSAKKK